MKILLLILFAVPIFGQENIKSQSSKNFQDTVKAIEKSLKDKKITIFAVIDHKKNAEQVKMTMPHAKLIIFGNPATGTFLIKDNPEWSYELPLRIAVYEDSLGKVWIKSRTLPKDVSTPKEQAKVIAANELLKNLVQKSL